MHFMTRGFPARLILMRGASRLCTRFTESADLIIANERKGKSREKMERERERERERVRERERERENELELVANPDVSQQIQH